MPLITRQIFSGDPDQRLAVILSRHNLSAFLLANGLLERTAFFERSIRIQQRSGRHESFKFQIDATTGFFIKQAKSSSKGRLRTLSAEARFYEFAKARALFCDALPRFIDYSETHQILTLEHIDGETVRDRCFFSQNCSTDDARELGCLLASMHRELSAERNQAFTATGFEERVPWLFTAESVGKAIQRSQAGGQAEVGAMVEEFPELQDATNQIRKEWMVTGLYHGDFKLENCLIRNSKAEGNGMVVVDWEFAGLGDQAWDVAGALQSYISLWIKTSRRTVWEEGDLSNPADGIPWREARRAIQAFWDGYCADSGFDPDQRRAHFEKCIRFTGVRLIQTAYEEMQRATRIHVYAIYLLQVAYNFLTDSTKWARRIEDMERRDEYSST